MNKTAPTKTEKSNRHSTRCLFCKSTFVKKGVGRCVKCVAKAGELAATVQPVIVQSCKDDSAPRGYLSRRGALEFDPSYYVIGRRFSMFVMALFMAFVACR